MALLQLRLFGPFSLEARQDGQPTPVRLPPRSAALLALLALARDYRLHRTEILDALWSEDPRGGGLASLSTALWRLRRALAPYAPAGLEMVTGDPGGRLALHPQAPLCIDASRFLERTAHALAKPLSMLCEDDALELASAVPLYRGDLLPEFDGDWARRERERLRRRFLDVLERLMQFALARGDVEEAIRRGHHLLEIDPLREDIHRALMDCHMRCGQRAMALRQFEACRQRLREALAIAPTAETVALYRALAAQAVEAPAEVR